MTGGQKPREGDSTEDEGERRNAGRAPLYVDNSEAHNVLQQEADLDVVAGVVRYRT